MTYTQDLSIHGLGDEKIFMTRLMTALCTLLFISGIGLDYVSDVNSLHEISYIRAFTCIALIGTYITTLKRDFFLQNYSLIIGSIYGIAALGIIVMIYLSEENSIASKTYFAGLMLVIITVFLGSYINTITSIAISSAIIILFLVMEIYLKNAHIYSIVNNVYFLGSSVIVGIISNSVRNKFILDRVFLQDRLKTALRNEKVVSKNNAILAQTDGLTGLANRSYSREKLEIMLKDAKSLDMALAVIYMDLNMFKYINDTHGHKVGDKVLKITAQRLNRIMRQSDLVSRQGGDEFLIAFLVNKSELYIVDDLIEKIPAQVSEPIKYNNLTLSVGASVGVAIYPTNGTTINSLIEIADYKMYQRKKLESKSRLNKHRQNNISNQSNVVSLNRTIHDASRHY